jgi:hypothetical protein
LLRPNYVNICDRAEQAPENDAGNILIVVPSTLPLPPTTVVELSLPSFNPLEFTNALLFDIFLLNAVKNLIKIAKVRQPNLIGMLSASNRIMKLKASTQTACT